MNHLYTENKDVQIVLHDYEFQNLINFIQRQKQKEYVFTCEAVEFEHMLSDLSTPIDRRNTNIFTNYIQRGYDINLLRDKITKLEQIIKTKDIEIEKLKFDKTAALKEFIAELRKEPLQVVLFEKDEE